MPRDAEMGEVKPCEGWKEGIDSSAPRRACRLARQRLVAARKIRCRFRHNIDGSLARPVDAFCAQR